MRKIYFNMNTPERRAAIMEKDEVVEMMIERPIENRIVGNVYLGKVTNVLPGMQAAFVDIGREKNGFIYRDHLLTYHLSQKDEADKLKSSVSEYVNQGETIFVQVIKEGFGKKGPRLTSVISLPGRYLVYMPNGGYVGVSKKIEPESERERLKKLGATLLNEQEGVVLRTICAGVSAEILEQELQYLREIWLDLSRGYSEKKAPFLLHQDSGLFEKMIRDFAHETIDEIVIDHLPDYYRLQNIMRPYPHLSKALKLYKGKENIFSHYGIEKELEKALKRQVWLKNGAYLMIDQTEALTVIDVNTGKYTGKTNLEDTVMKTNIEAAKEIARQLRLRDIAGIIIVDFIDMRTEDSKQKLLKVLKESLRGDRTKTNVLGLTDLGLVEMTRKKIRENLQSSLSKHCPTCHGKGTVLSDEAQAFKIERHLWELKGGDHEAVLLEMPSKIQSILVGEGGEHLNKLEEALGFRILLFPSKRMKEERFEVRFVGNLKEAGYHLERLKENHS
ncbi:RNAse G [Bacillus sp. TS-2]|nr:RNAse G [Bacillus sp. TS-2]